MLSDFHLQRPLSVYLIKAQVSLPRASGGVLMLKAGLKVSSPEPTTLWDGFLSASFLPKGQFYWRKLAIEAQSQVMWHSKGRRGIQAG